MKRSKQTAKIAEILIKKFPGMTTEEAINIAYEILEALEK